MRKGYHIFVSGRVQGVGFRFRTKLKAEGLNLVGWVRNLDDGRVEILVEGEEENIKKLESWLKSEPFFTKIENLEIEEIIPSNQFESFEIRY